MQPALCAGTASAFMAQIPAANQKHAKSVQSIAHIGTIGGVSVALAEEQRRLSEAGLCYVTEKHDTPKVCQTLERCYDRL
jgi:hypothetical protein